MKAHRPLYSSYLLRLWKEGPGLDWRASLQDVLSGECRNFADLNGLCAFLKTETDFGISLPSDPQPIGENPGYRD